MAQVLFFSAEMRGAELTHKMASLRSGISVADVRNNRIDEQAHDDYAAALAYAAALPIHVTDMPFPTTDDMYEVVKTYLDNGMAVPLVCFDYLGIAGDEVERGAEHLRIKQIAARLKNLAKLTNVPVLAVGQTNRTINESKTKLPAPSTTAGSEDVNRFADISLGLCWPEYWLRDGETVLCEHVNDATNTIYVNTVKSRWGERAKIYRLDFRSSITRFADLAVNDQRPRLVRQKIVRSPTDDQIAQRLLLASRV